MSWIYNEGALKAKFERLDKLSQQNRKKLEKVASRNERKFQMTKEEYNKYKAILYKKTNKEVNEENKELQRQNRILKELEEEYRQYDGNREKEFDEVKEKTLTSGLIKTIKKSDFKEIPVDEMKTFVVPQEAKTLKQISKPRVIEVNEDKSFGEYNGLQSKKEVSERRSSPKKKEEGNQKIFYGNIKVLGRARSPENSRNFEKKDIGKKRTKTEPNDSNLAEVQSPLESYLKIKFDEINSIIKNEKPVENLKVMEGVEKNEKKNLKERLFSLASELEKENNDRADDEEETEEAKELKKIIKKLESERDELENRLDYLSKAKPKPQEAKRIVSPKKNHSFSSTANGDELDFEKKWEIIESNGRNMGFYGATLTPKRTHSINLAKLNHSNMEADSITQDLNEHYFSNKSKSNDLMEFELLLSRSSEHKRKSPLSSDEKSSSPRVFNTRPGGLKTEGLADKESIDRLADEIESLMRIQRNFREGFEENKGREEEVKSANKRTLLKYKMPENHQLFEIEEVSIENSVSLI